MIHKLRTLGILTALILILAYQTNISALTQAYDFRIKIKDPYGSTAAVVKLGDDKSKIAYFDAGIERILTGKHSKIGKWKYSLSSLGQIAEVKNKADGFKVRTPQGNLLWKVKLAGDKIKISNNEKGNQSFVLSKKYDDYVKVLHDTVELGKVKFYPDKIKVKSVGNAELYRCNTHYYSAAYGVLLMDAIPWAERYIIMAELLARER